MGPGHPENPALPDNPPHRGCHRPASAHDKPLLGLPERLSQASWLLRWPAHRLRPVAVLLLRQGTVEVTGDAFRGGSKELDLRGAAAGTVLQGPHLAQGYVGVAPREVGLRGHQVLGWLC